MAGTKAGGLKVVETNKRKYGEGYYQKIGRMGGKAKKSAPFGFQTMDHERLRQVSSVGGRNAQKAKREAL